MNTGAMHTLHPGDVVCAERGDRLETLLGSCVAIILTDPRRTLGAMCHIVHTSPASGSQSDSTAHAANALAAMYSQLRQHGINPRMCDAYVYGGGNMFPALFPRAHVGEVNARWALRALADDGISVVAQDLGGASYRRLGWTVGVTSPEVKAVQVQDLQ
jgi:chemotaxis protein CheD